MELFSSIIFKKVKPLQEHTTHHCLTSWRQKNGHICRKRKSCFTKTTHRLTPQWLPWRKSTNYGLNCLTSPDLAPSDFFFLFPHLKIAVGGQRFSSNEEAITFVNNYFAEKNAKYYLNGLQRWEHRWEKCVELQGDYVEK